MYFKKLSRINELNTRLTYSLLKKISNKIDYKIYPSNNGKFIVAMISDIFMRDYYEGAFEEIIDITPKNYKKYLTERPIDFFIYISCWFGVDGKSWRMNDTKKIDENISEIVGFCKSNGIKTIFQSIEDPINYDFFSSIAKKFDYIFTTDLNSINRYKKDCQHENVWQLSYGVNPIIHNPFGRGVYNYHNLFFAGSYYKRHVERCHAMQDFIETVNERKEKLIIANRNFSSDDEDLKFPIDFNDYIYPAFKYKDVLLVHKLFRYSLNFNTIIDSPTMCAMRTYELQASGGVLISNNSRALGDFKNILSFGNKADIGNILDSINSFDQPRLERNSIINIFEKSTVFHRASQMLTLCGLSYKFKDYFPKIIVLYDNDSINARLKTKQLINYDLEFMKTSSLANTLETENSILLFSSILPTIEKDWFDFLIVYFRYFKFDAVCLFKSNFIKYNKFIVGKKIPNISLSLFSLVFIKSFLEKNKKNISEKNILNYVKGSKELTVLEIECPDFGPSKNDFNPDIIIESKIDYVGMSFNWEGFIEEIVNKYAVDNKPIFVQEAVIPWNVGLFQRPQQMAMAIGKLGILVIYRTFQRDNDGLKQDIMCLSENVWITDSENVDYLENCVRSVYSTSPGCAGDFTNKEFIDGKILYEYIDHIDEMISGDEHIKSLLQLKKWAIDGGADFILASANKLYVEMNELVSYEKMIMVPNGVDPNHYRLKPQEYYKLPETYMGFRKKYKYIIGYFGAIAPWLWYELINTVVDEMSDCGFVFIGEDYYNGLKELEKQENLLYLGVVPYVELPYYSNLFDICFIPFELGEIARSTSPLKLFEYFAMEKPIVVTSELLECIQYQEVFHGASVDEIKLAIRSAILIKDDESYKSKMRCLANENSWANRAKVIINSIC